MNSTNGQRRKLLLIASCCDGTDVGEAWISFEWVSRLAARHDVTLLTYRKRDRAAAGPQVPNARVVEWLDLPLVGRWERFNSMLKPGYVSFYIRARTWIKDRLRAGEKFDLAHQITPVALRYPSPAVGLGIPLVIGPLGGSVGTPRAFVSEFGGAAWYTKLRNLDAWRLKHDTWLRRSYASADLLIGVAPYVRDLLDGLVSRKFESMSEIGVVEIPRLRARRPLSGRPLQLLFVGRVVRSKGVRDAIRALAQLRDIGPVRFDVVGWGEDLEPCRREAQQLGLGETVFFWGRLPRKEVEPLYATADVFVFPSFREASGIAVIEAMSHGLPLIVADRGGPGFVVDDAIGFRVPVKEPTQFASDIAACIRQLASSPSLIASMGAAAREKVKSEYLWDAKVRRIAQLYEAVLSGRAPARADGNSESGMRAAV